MVLYTSFYLAHTLNDRPLKLKLHVLRIRAQIKSVGNRSRLRDVAIPR